MQKSKIEWCDFSINPIKGLCPMSCSYCYARRMYKRFKWNPELRYDASAWLGLGNLKTPSRIFVGSTMELFGDFIKPEWMYWILELPYEFPQHTFIFLTKQPKYLANWSPFPENCWVGVSVENDAMLTKAWSGLRDVNARVKFVSIEPLLKWDMPFNDMVFTFKNLNWLIIGQQTPISKKTEPRIEWIKDIVESADKAGVKVFLKNNLVNLLLQESDKAGLFWRNGKLRQEFPNEK